MLLGFIGNGIVGGATRKLAEEYGHTSRVYDPPQGFNDSMDGCEAVFISVPVPTLPNGKQDLKILVDALRRCPKKVPIFIRSSVLPGTSNYVEEVELEWDHKNNRWGTAPARVYALPEFLTERQADADSKRLPIVVPEKAADIISKIFPGKQLLKVGSNGEAELVKYAHNAFCAVKVGFFNTVRDVCVEHKLDYDRVVDAACGVTGFIERTHTKVPGPDGEFGFGGKCLPKDLFALVNFIEGLLGKKTFLRDVLNENFLNRFGGLF